MLRCFPSDFPRRLMVSTRFQCLLYPSRSRSHFQPAVTIALFQADQCPRSVSPPLSHLWEGQGLNPFPPLPRFGQDGWGNCQQLGGLFPTQVYRSAAPRRVQRCRAPAASCSSLFLAPLSHKLLVMPFVSVLLGKAHPDGTRSPAAAVSLAPAQHHPCENPIAPSPEEQEDLA